MPRPAASPTVVCAAVLAALGATAGCGGDGGSDAERFCGEVQVNTAAIVDPTIATVEDLDATLALYREIGELAPAAIAEEWGALVVNLETASTVVPGDPESVQRAVTQAYATERSAVLVRDWLLDNCGVDLGPVTTITPQEPLPAPTLPPATTGG